MNGFRGFKAVFVALVGYLCLPAWADTNFTDLWWNPAESGWGITLTQEYNGPIFATMYVYDGAGKATWLTGVMNPRTNSGVSKGPNRSYEGSLFESSGGSVLTQGAFNSTGVSTVSVGMIRFIPDSAYDGTLSYTYKGVSVTKKIERFSVSAVSLPSATTAGTAAMVTAQSINNGSCTATFPANTVDGQVYRMVIATTETGYTWTIGQCDQGGEAGSCTISSPICTFTGNLSDVKSRGNSLHAPGKMNCTVGGSANLLTGGKTGNFDVELDGFRKDNHGYTGLLGISDGLCIGGTSLMIKSKSWISSCAFSLTGDDRDPVCTN
jgi:hypothetical protein